MKIKKEWLIGLGLIGLGVYLYFNSKTRPRSKEEIVKEVSRLVNEYFSAEGAHKLPAGTRIYKLSSGKRTLVRVPGKGVRKDLPEGSEVLHIPETGSTIITIPETRKGRFSIPGVTKIAIGRKYRGEEEIKSRGIWHVPENIPTDEYGWF